MFDEEHIRDLLDLTYFPELLAMPIPTYVFTGNLNPTPLTIPQPTSLYNTHCQSHIQSPIQSPMSPLISSPLNTTPPTTPSPPISIAKPPKPLLRCTYCNKTFTRPYALKSHLLVHSAQGRPFPCIVSDCQSSFVRKHDLHRFE